ELIGQRATDLIHPDDRSIAASAIEAMGRGERSHVRFRLRRKDGGWVDCESVGAAIRDEMGRAVLILATARDVTEQLRADRALRDSESRFRALSDATVE